MFKKINAMNIMNLNTHKIFSTNVPTNETCIAVYFTVLFIFRFVQLVDHKNRKKKIKIDFGIYFCLH